MFKENKNEEEGNMNGFKKVLGTLCDNCPLCKYARGNPETIIGRIMEWHGKWCPAWKAYEEFNKEKKERLSEK